MMHQFAARAARAASTRGVRQASNVAVPSSAETQGFARDGVSSCTPSARRRPGTARRRGGRRLQCARRRSRRDPRRPLSAQVLGAAGGIGQPLSLLLKADPLVSGLSLYDVVNTPGVAADLSHCNTPATVTGVTGVGNAEEALKGADVVVIPAGSSFSVLFFSTWATACGRVDGFPCDGAVCRGDGFTSP